MRFRLFVVFAGAVAGWGCSDGSNPPPPDFGNDTDSTNSGGASSDTDASSGGSTSTGGSGGSESTGTGGEAGEGATSSAVATSGGGSDAGGSGGASSGGDGGVGASSGGGSGPSGGSGGSDGTMLPEVDPCPSDDLNEPPDFDTVCDLDPTWGEGQPLALGGSDGEQLTAITPDELTVVWFSPGRSEGQFLAADRATPDDDFGTPVIVPAPRVLSAGPNGLRLVTSEQGTSLATVSRSNRGDEFAEPVEGEFELLNAYAAENALLFKGTVISPDDQTLYYTVSGLEDDAYPVQVSQRNDDGPWPVGEALSSCEFKAYGALVRVPTGISSDGLTIFFQDPAAGGARAAFRETTDSEFSWFVDLGAIAVAQPNGACDRLYYWDEESSSVLVSERE